MTTATSSAGAVAPAAGIKWEATQARMVQLSRCGRFAVTESVGGKHFTAIDYHAITVASPVFADSAEARAWCEHRAAEHPTARGQDVNGDDWTPDELPRW